MPRGLVICVAVAATLLFSSVGSTRGEIVPKKKLGVVKAEWRFAPEMPPPINRREPKIVEVSWHAKETQAEIVPGQKYLNYWTIEGRVPGPVLRIRVGDVVRVTFSNDIANEYAHNIDFHFVTGPGGGAPALSVAKGESATIEARAMTPGFFMYHCATHDIPMHISNGMYGFVLVEPARGLPKADREYYITQSEFYTDDAGDGALKFSLDKGDREEPTYMFFNGAYGAISDEHALQAKVGEKVRLYVGNAGPNKISSFHVIGEIFDKVWREADLVSAPARSLQTTLIPAGGATVVELSADIPGKYMLVDHAIFRLHKGLSGELVVEGRPNPEVFEVIKAGSAPSGH